MPLVYLLEIRCSLEARQLLCHEILVCDKKFMGGVGVYWLVLRDLKLLNCHDRVNLNFNGENQIEFQ